MSTPDSTRWLKLPVFLNYGAAILSVVAALFVAQWMKIQYDFQPLTPFLCAIMFSAWLGGLKPGLLAVALSLLAFQHYFLSYINPLDVEKEIPRLLLAAATALFIMSLTAAQRSATQALRESELRLRQVAQRLKESQAKFEAFMKHSPALMFIKELDGRYQYVNDQFCSSFGLERDTVLEHTDAEIFSADQAARFQANDASVVAANAILEFEETAEYQDGRHTSIVCKFPIRDASDRIAALGGVVTDITARKNAEEALRRSERKLHEQEALYRMLTETANDFIRVHELDGRSIYASPSVVRLYGQEPAHIFQFAHPEDLANCWQWWERLLAKGRETLIWRVLVRDGGSRWMETQGSVVQYQGRPHVMTVCRDVTEWKTAEDALRESEQRYLSLFENMAEGVVYLRMLFENGEPRDAVYLDVNPAWENFTGLKNVVGRKASEVVPGIREASPVFFERVGTVAITGQSERFEIYVAPMKKWFSIAAYCPQQEHVIVVMDDITERKQAQDHLRLVLDTTPALIHTGRPDGYLNYFNQRWLEYAGRSLEDLQGWAWTATIHPEDVEGIVNRWRASIASGEPFEHEARVRRADGAYRWMLHRKVLLRDEHGIIVKWYGSCTDIEDRKQAEHALRESQQLLQLVLATLPVGVGVTNCAGDFVLNNAASKDVWGDTIGAGPARWARSVAFWHDSGKRIAPAEWASVRALSEGQTSLNELIDIETYDGKKKVIQNSSAPIRNTEGQIVGAVIVNEDVTERVRAVEELQEAASQLEALSRRLVELQEFERKELARELHDRIGQSLTALNINLKILATTLPQQASNELRARLADSEALVEHTTAAIRNVMSELRPPMLDDQGLVPALEWHAKQLSARTGIAVAVRGLEPAERPAAELEIALFRVVQEALNNVVKHARASRVEINFERSDSEYVMTVEDDGVGFDAVEDSVAWRTGLGMVTMRERTQALGGRLEVRAGHGDGTRLTVRLPA